MGSKIIKEGSKMTVELDRRYLNMDEMAQEVCRNIKEEGKGCEIITKGAMPVLLVDGIKYGLTTISTTFGQRAVLTVLN